jgi:hypothetical protein
MQEWQRVQPAIKAGSGIVQGGRCALAGLRQRALSRLRRESVVMDTPVTLLIHPDEKYVPIKMKDIAGQRYCFNLLLVIILI